MPHLNLDMATLVLEGELPPRVLMRLLYDHVKELCPECRAALEAVQGMPARPAAEPLSAAAAPHPEQVLATTDGAARRLGERLRRAEEERRRARRDLAALRALPPEEREARVHSARSRFRSRALAELLVEASRQTVRRDAAEAVALAGLVPVVLARISCPLGRAAAPKLRVLALAHRGNALRVGGDLPAADRALAEARRALAAAAPGDSPLHAELCSLEASLRFDQRRFDEAELLLDRSILLSRMGHDDRALAKALIQRANLLGERQDLAAAGESLREALELLDGSGDRHLLACAIGTLITLEHDRGAFTAAEQLLGHHRSLLVGDGGAWWMMRLLVMEGRIALGLGRHAEAEDRLLRAYELSAGGGSELDAAVALLELAVLYAEQGRMAEVRRIARRVQPVFASREMHRDATAALVLFQQAGAAERVTVEAIRSLRDMLQRQSRGAVAADEGSS